MSEMSDEFRKDLEALAKDIEFRAKVARDAHFLGAERWDTVNFWLGLSTVLVGVVGGASAGAILANLPLASVVATAAGLLGAANSFLKPGDRAERHKRAGDSWSILRDQAAELYALKLKLKSISDDELQKMYDSILTRKEEITKNSPIIPEWAYKRAHKKKSQQAD